MLTEQNKADLKKGLPPELFKSILIGAALDDWFEKNGLTHKDFEWDLNPHLYIISIMEAVIETVNQEAGEAICTEADVSIYWLTNAVVYGKYIAK